MNNKAFIAELSDRTGFTQEDTQRLVRAVIDAMTVEFERGNQVSIDRLGTFAVKKRLEREIINPATKQHMLVPPKLVLSFRPAATVKEKLKKEGEKDE